METNNTQNMEEKIRRIVNWLKDYKEKSRQKGFVLGLSGGIDSSVVAHLIMRACPQNSLGVIMPAGNKPQDREDAIAAAKSSRLPYIEVDLTQYRQGLFDEITKALLQKGYQSGDTQMVRGNLGARLRMTCLLYTSLPHQSYPVPTYCRALCSVLLSLYPYHLLENRHWEREACLPIMRIHSKSNPIPFC